MMTVDWESVQRVAQLSRLALSETELADMQRELAGIFHYIKTLEMFEAEEQGIPAPKEPYNITREDDIQPSADRARLLGNAAVHTEEFIVVPKTVE